MNGLVGDVALLVIGIGVLYFGADWLVRGAASLASSLGVSPIVVGLTVVSMGTSAPELVVCLVAAFGHNPDLVVGNVLGSNLANIGLILGLSAIVRPLDVHARVVALEMPLMLLVTAGLYPLAWDLEIGRVDGIVLLVGLIAYLVFVFRSIEKESPEILGEYEQFIGVPEPPRRDSMIKDVTLVVAGSGCLVVGGYCIVEGAVAVASALGISQVVIGLTVVAVGTSLPELATSLVAAIRKEADIAVGNVIGSNIFNIAAIMGISSLVEPIPIERIVLGRELPVVLAMSMLLYPLLRTGWRIRRWEGAVLLIAYAAAGFLVL